jgi:HK97 family phage portal protein
MIGDLFPAIRDALKELRAGFGSEPLSLGLKEVTFTTSVSSEELRKFYSIYPSIANSVGYSEPSWTGKTATETSALNIAAVWRCVQVIAQALATLPAHVMENTARGKRVADQHPLDWVLYRRPNKVMTSIRMRQTMMAHVLLWGNAYALKVKHLGNQQTIGLWPWTPDKVRVEVGSDGLRKYFYNNKEYSADDVFHLPGLGFDGIRGYSVVSMARQSLGLAMAQDEYTGRYFSSGGRRPYVLEKKIPFQNEDRFKEFRARWDEAYGGAANSHKPVILEGDIAYKELGMPLKDAELLASRQFSIAEICRWFGVQPHLAFDLERSTNNNIEHQGLEFIQQTLLYWTSLWEQEAEAQLLTDGEQGRYFIKFNMNALMRADFKTRMEGYSIGLQNGMINPDFVADREDWDALPNGAGEAYHIQLNMQTLPGTGEPTAAERAALAKIDMQKPNGGDDGKQAG